MTEHDFYAGFEGEPELILEYRQDGHVRGTIRAWSGYFDQLMARHDPPEDGWRGLALHHHLGTGWNEQATWSDPDPRGTLAIILDAHRKAVDEDVRLFADALVQLLEQCVSNGGAMLWRLE